MNDIFFIISEILHYIFNITITEIPLHIGYTVVIFLVSYGLGAFIVSFPISIYEEFTKREVKAKDKIEHHARFFFSIAMGIWFLYELATTH